MAARVGSRPTKPHALSCKSHAVSTSLRDGMAAAWVTCGIGLFSDTGILRGSRPKKSRSTSFSHVDGNGRILATVGRQWRFCVYGR